MPLLEPAATESGWRWLGLIAVLPMLILVGFAISPKGSVFVLRPVKLSHASHRAARRRSTKDAAHGDGRSHTRRRRATLPNPVHVPGLDVDDSDPAAKARSIPLPPASPTFDLRTRARPQSWHPRAGISGTPPSSASPSEVSASIPSSPTSPAGSSWWPTVPAAADPDRVYSQLLETQAHLRSLMEHAGGPPAWWSARFAVLGPLHAKARRAMYVARDLLPSAWQPWMGAAEVSMVVGGRPVSPAASSIVGSRSRPSSMHSHVRSALSGVEGGNGSEHAESTAAAAEDDERPVVIALASAAEAQRVEVIHARARARAAAGAGGDALAAVLEVIYPPAASRGTATTESAEALVVLKQYACSVEDRLRSLSPTTDEARTVVMFVLVHACMLAEIGVALAEAFCLDHVLVKDALLPLTMRNLILSGYQNMYTVSGAVAVVDAASDHAAHLELPASTRTAVAKLVERVARHYTRPLPLDLDPVADLATLHALYEAIARNDA
ncbi:hypothetical protein H9P43_009921 [Blastocladiella emersonii ATCC 22665]|nr:hypothetical protein H9P43_009921 [Blastocladiella emersonii ATCC 22665]